MRGKAKGQPEFLTTLNLNQRVPADHPLRGIKERMDKVLLGLSPLFDELYSADFLRRYQQAGAGSLVKLIVLEGQGRNCFEGFFHSQELVDSAIARARAGAGL